MTRWPCLVGIFTFGREPYDKKTVYRGDGIGVPQGALLSWFSLADFLYDILSTDAKPPCISFFYYFFRV